jgi:hypothetical protein
MGSAHPPPRIPTHTSCDRLACDSEHPSLEPAGLVKTTLDATSLGATSLGAVNTDVANMDARDIRALIEENARLKELVVQLSALIMKNVIDHH